MYHLVVVDYEDAFKAREVRTNLLKKEESYLSEIEDAVVAVKKPDSSVTVDHMAPLTEGEALGDSFLGNLIGSIFHQPEPGEHAPGKPHGALDDLGVSDEFMKDVAKTLQPGHSALFVLVRPESEGKVMEELRASGGTMLRAPLSQVSKTLLQAKS
jgi:uncharacterized membrane protein